MKPLKLEMQAFGPFPDLVTIDFAKLADKGVYLIKGPTGSGKSTIFDAITLALYGECGDTNRNDLEAWRCTQAKKEVDTLISFTFSERGHVYRFARRVIPKRVKNDTTLEAGEVDENGNVIPFFAHLIQKNMAAKAEEIIGLDREQFTQVVVIPQGKFEDFLLAKSGDKEDILGKIFGAEKWQKYTDTFYKNADNRKKELDNVFQNVQSVLAANGVQDMAGLVEKIAEIKQQLADLEADHTAFDGEGKKKQLDVDKELSHAFDTLHGLEQVRDTLMVQSATIEAKKTTLAKADEAEPFRGLMDTATRYKLEAEKRQNELIVLTNKVPGVDKAVQTANDDLQKHIDASPVTALNKEIVEYESKRPDYAGVGALKIAFDDASATWNKAVNAKDIAVKKAENAKIDASGKLETYNAAHMAADTAEQAYYNGIYGELAQELRDGEPCPVCGSISHPTPAKRSTESVTRDKMLLAKKAAQIANETFKTADAVRETADRMVVDAEAARAKAETEKAMAEANYTNAQKNLIAGIADEKALEAAIAGKQSQIDTYKKREQALLVAVQNAEKEKTALDTQIETAKKEWEKAELQAKASATALADALNKAGYPEDGNDVRAMMKSEAERNKLREEIARYDQSCRENKDMLAAQQAKLTGKTEPDKTAFTLRDTTIMEEQRKYNVEKTKMDAECRRLEALQRDLEPKDTYYRDNSKQADDDLATARALRGDIGMGLQRYVLAIMFGQVIDEANRMLEKVHGGRYTLCRTDERGTRLRQGGLELRVLDARMPEAGMRNVSSLSGGEKFLVSLALSIGLSVFAQRSGVRIEALFIDEGFGTLDDTSIADALVVLDSVRSGGTVGIISHVKLLEENIPTQIKIIKTDNGSYIA